MFNKKLRHAIRTRAIIAVLIICALLSIVPLFHRGFFSSDDGGWMIIRFSAFHQAFIHGQIPTRFLPRLNYEYGYPVADFLYPGFMYLGEPIHLLKIDFVNTIKIIFGLSLISSSFFVYFWLKKIFTPLAALVGSIVYLYSPYHLTDMYVRGSIGEVLALAVVPFVLWMIEENNILVAGLGIGFLLLAHNTLALLFLPLLFIYSIICHSREGGNPAHTGLVKVFILFILGVGLAAFFWLPALYDLRYTIFSQTKVADWQQYFSNLVGIGILNILIFLFAAASLLFPKKLHMLVELKAKFSEKQKKLTVFFFILSGVTIFLALPFSNFVWKLLPVSLIQFPFRILSIEILGCSFLTAFGIHYIKKWFKKPGTYIIIILMLLLSLPIFTNIRYEDKALSFYSTNEDTTTVRNEYMPQWVKILSDHKPEQKVLDKNIDITNLHDTVNKISFTAKLRQNKEVTVNTLYFPGWFAKIDGKPIQIRYNNPKGLIQIPIPAGRHIAQIYFSETPVRIVSDMISLLCLLGLFIFSSILRKKGRQSML